MYNRSLAIFRNHYAAVTLIAGGIDLWDSSLWTNSHKRTLLQFRRVYLYEYCALPTNTHFVERGVKESGYVCLGRQGEHQRSVLAISRGKLLPDATKKGRDEINKNNDEKKGSCRENKKQRYWLENCLKKERR